MKLFFSTFLASSLLLGTLAAQDEPQSKAVEKLAEAEQHYDNAQAIARAAYRKDLAQAIAASERIELYLIDSNTAEFADKARGWETKVPEGRFPIVGEGQTCEVLSKIVLTPEQRAEFLPALGKSFTAEESSGVLCHYPFTASAPSAAMANSSSKPASAGIAGTTTSNIPIA